MEKKKGKLLIVDDNQSVLHSLKLFLQFEFSEVFLLKNPQHIPELLKKEEIDVILLDMNFTTGKDSGAEGIIWLRKILELDPQSVVVMITAYGDIELAVKAIKEGAIDFVVKPWENRKLLSSLQSAFQLSQSRKTIKKLRETQSLLFEEINRDYSDFLGYCPEMQNLNDTIQKVASTEANILILGENGTGKELIARNIHKYSFRKEEAFIHIDLGALNPNLIESELFGHTKGAFTDARENRIGRFETASGGTLFLDEIGNLDLALQCKLLSAIQNRIISPIGSNRQIPVDIRLICATNQNLTEMIREGLFREDLYYRINTIEIEVPPLRERGQDIIVLARHFLKRYANKYGKPVPKLTGKISQQLRSHSWPGNVRELMHSMEKAVILSENAQIHPGDIIGHRSRPSKAADLSILSLEEAEAEWIRKALKKNHGNLSKTAQELKIARQTLYNKMTKYGI